MALQINFVLLVHPSPLLPHSRLSCLCVFPPTHLQHPYWFHVCLSCSTAFPPHLKHLFLPSHGLLVSWLHPPTLHLYAHLQTCKLVFVCEQEHVMFVFLSLSLLVTLLLTWYFLFIFTFLKCSHFHFFSQRQFYCVYVPHFCFHYLFISLWASRLVHFLPIVNNPVVNMELYDG